VSLALRLQRRADRRSALRTYLFSLAYSRAAVRAMVIDTAAVDPRPWHRRLARRNIRTAFVALRDHGVHVRHDVRGRPQFYTRVMQ
jgi:hypothetical protein